MPHGQPETSTALTRRAFLARSAERVAGGAALLVAGPAIMAAAGCDEGETETADLGDGMHGPVRIAEFELRRPEAPSAKALFEPYALGEPFHGRWAIAHLTKGRREQLVVVLVDLDTGGHAELELWAPKRGVSPLAETERYMLLVDNGGRGDFKTPRHMVTLAERLADIVRANEMTASLDWALPSLSA